MTIGKLKKNYIVLIIVFLSFNTLAVGGEIFEPNPLNFIEFDSYQIVDSEINGTILTRLINVTIMNTTDKLINELTLTIDGIPNFATVIDPVIFIGTINPGERITANIPFTLSVDTSELTDDGLRIIWQIECVLDGKNIFDETVVIESL